MSAGTAARELLWRGIRRAFEIVERFTLEERDVRTIATKDVIIRNSGVPWFAGPLIRFINRFCKPVQPDKLNAICEDGA